MFEDIMWIGFASLLTAVAVNGVFIHDGLAPGGLTGLALVISSITHVDVDILTIIISIPILLIATKVLGKSFGAKTLLMVFLTPVLMRIVPKYPLTFWVGSLNSKLELLIGGILGGILIGSSIGIALNRKCATGGTDIVAILLNKIFKKVTVPHLILALDGIIIILSGFVKQDLWVSVFSFISLFIITQTIQKFVGK